MAASARAASTYTSAAGLEMRSPSLSKMMFRSTWMCGQDTSQTLSQHPHHPRYVQHKQFGQMLGIAKVRSFLVYVTGLPYMEAGRMLRLQGQDFHKKRCLAFQA